MIGMWNIEENCQDWDPLKNDMLYSFAAAIWLWHSYRMTGNLQRIDSLHKKDVKMNKQMSAICVYKHC